MVDVIDADLDECSFSATMAVVLVTCAATFLAILPAAIALHAPGVPPGWAAAALGTLAVVIAVGKLAAMAWGAGSRLWGGHRARLAATYAD
jgi:hypothetical protein